MSRLVLEGTWEEIAAHADELAGTRLKVTVEEGASEVDNQPNIGPPNIGPPNVRPPNEQMLNILRSMAERQKDRPYTSGEGTQELIRQARNGGMYGMGPLDQ